MSEFVYRFRPTKSLWKFNELENQEVYCASLGELNDPMEGFKDLFWLGDEIVWINLLKHYLLCLDRVCIQFLLVGDTHEIRTETMPVFETEDDLPTQTYKDYFKDIYTKFFVAESIAEYAKSLSSICRPMRREELHCHLRVLHFHALNSIFEVYQKKGFMPNSSGAETFRKMCEQIPVNSDVFRFEKEHPEYSDSVDPMYTAISGTHTQLALVNMAQGASNNLEHVNRHLIFDAFPSRYIKMLEKVVHLDWYAACFSGDYTSSTMWGHYADGHRGVCLKLSTTDQAGKPSLALRGITGWRSSRADSAQEPICGPGKYQLHKIAYENAYPEIDFFRSLGRLRGVAADWWYSDGRGKSSKCAADVYGNEAEWRERYWATFLKCQTTKVSDWAYEEEYRLVLNSLITDYSDGSRRKLKYDFADLRGIIFGINTSDDDKLKIIRIIKQKCLEANRKDFEFYQAFYVKRTGKIATLPMSLL
jgi:hypothetical protein